MSICDNCKASKRIKDTMGCNADRLHNAWEDFKHEFCKLAKTDYQPKYQCRFADLVEKEMEGGEMSELKPCPFCGGSAKFISFVDACSHRPACLVRCNDCGALTKDFVAEDSTFSYKDEARNAWNTRTLQNDEVRE